MSVSRLGNVYTGDYSALSTRKPETQNGRKDYSAFHPFCP